MVERRKTKWVEAKTLVAFRFLGSSYGGRWRTTDPVEGCKANQIDFLSQLLCRVELGN
jgi:hypothetical protein